MKIRITETNNNGLSSLLLGHTNSTTLATSSLSMLTTDTESPVVTETTVTADLLQTLKIITKLGFDIGGEELKVVCKDNKNREKHT